MRSERALRAAAWFRLFMSLPWAYHDLSSSVWIAEVRLGWEHLTQSRKEAYDTDATSLMPFTVSSNILEFESVGDEGSGVECDDVLGLSDSSSEPFD